MPVTRTTIRLMRRLRRDIGAETDTVARTLTSRWIAAWDQLRPAWATAVDDMVDAAVETGRWPAAGKLLRTRSVDQAMAATITALNRLAELTRQQTTDGADRLIRLDADTEAQLIASQAPAAEEPGLRRHVVSQTGGEAATEARRQAWAVRESARDDIDLLINDRVHRQTIDTMTTRVAGQVTAVTWPLSAEATDVMRRELVRGIEVGDNPRHAASRMLTQVEHGFNGGLSRALTISRTEMLDAYRTTAAQIHQANSDVVPAWQYYAEIDDLTCVACWGMHGTIHPVTEPGPDDHQRGRCTRLPVMSSWAELGIKAPEPPDAPIDPEATFWALPRSTQLKIMGPTRLRLLEDGQVGWGDLATRRTNPGWRPSIAPRPVRDLQQRADQRLPPTPAGPRSRNPTPAPAPAPAPPLPQRRPRAATPPPETRLTAGQILDLDDTAQAAAAARQIYEGTFAGLRVVVDSVERSPTSLNVQGVIHNQNGRAVGSFERDIVLRQDDLVAFHSYLSLDSRIQGQGFARAYNQHLEAWYRASGVDRIELLANIDIGGYAWARQGYDWRTERDAHEIWRRLEQTIAEHSGRMSTAQVQAGLTLLERAYGTPFGDAAYPSAYEVSQLGRPPGATADDMWLGKLALLGSSWRAVKPL